MTWTESVLSHMYPWPIGVLVIASAVSFVFGAIGVWALWRVKSMMATVPVVQERLDSLANSVTLLTDTTESCFKALSMQMQFVQSQAAAPAAAPRPRVAAPAAEPADDVIARKGRQRRVVGALRRGEAVSAVAAREDMAEAEVALRLHLNHRDVTVAEAKRHGALLS